VSVLPVVEWKNLTGENVVFDGEKWEWECLPVGRVYSHGTFALICPQ